MGKFLNEVVKDLRKPLIEGRGIKVFPLQETKSSKEIARKIYHSSRGKTRKDKVSLIQQEAGVGRRQANKLYNDIDMEDTVRYVTRNEEQEEYSEDHDCKVEDEGHCDVCGAWMDPAGGVHAADEENPASMYESRNGVGKVVHKVSKRRNRTMCGIPANKLEAGGPVPRKGSTRWRGVTCPRCLRVGNRLPSSPVTETEDWQDDYDDNSHSAICPKCGSKNVKSQLHPNISPSRTQLKCEDCGYVEKVPTKKRE